MPTRPAIGSCWRALVTASNGPFVHRLSVLDNSWVLFECETLYLVLLSCIWLTAGSQISGLIYTFIDDARQIDSTMNDLLQEILGLSRVSKAVSGAWKDNPMIATAQVQSEGDLWGSVKSSLDDCEDTLRKLEKKLNEIQKSFKKWGILKKPAKLIKLNMEMKDILLYKQQVHSYNNAMQSALQMINM